MEEKYWLCICRPISIEGREAGSLPAESTSHLSINGFPSSAARSYFLANRALKLHIGDYLFRCLVPIAVILDYSSVSVFYN